MGLDFCEKGKRRDIFANKEQCPTAHKNYLTYICEHRFRMDDKPSVATLSCWETANGIAYHFMVHLVS